MPRIGRTTDRAVVDWLLNSDEPSIRWKTRVGILGEDPTSTQIHALREQVRNSQRVKTLLARRDNEGRIVSVNSVYDKWQGAHWIMASLADLGYPERAHSLIPAPNQTFNSSFTSQFYHNSEAF